MDPGGLKDGPNVYSYCSNNPVVRSDTKGMQGEPAEKQKKAEQPTSLEGRSKETTDQAASSFAEFIKQYAEANQKAMDKIVQEIQYQQALRGKDFKEVSPGHFVLKQPSLKQEAADLYNRQLISRDKNAIRLHVDPVEGTTLGFDFQIGGSGVGLATDKPKGSFDALQLTLLPMSRNLELIPLYNRYGLDISLFKEPASQVQVQRQPKDTGKGWETHTTLGGTVDVFNLSIDPLGFEAALTGSGGYDFTGQNVAITAVLGIKYTLFENVKVPIFGTLGTNKGRSMQESGSRETSQQRRVRPAVSAGLAGAADCFSSGTRCRRRRKRNKPEECARPALRSQASERTLGVRRGGAEVGFKSISHYEP